MTIVRQIMELHVTKHHQAYVTNLNNALAQYAEVSGLCTYSHARSPCAWPSFFSQAESKGDLAKMIALQGALKFNGGGAILWHSRKPFSKLEIVLDARRPRQPQHLLDKSVLAKGVLLLL